MFRNGSKNYFFPRHPQKARAGTACVHVGNSFDWLAFAVILVLVHRWETVRAHNRAIEPCDERSKCTNSRV